MSGRMTTTEAGELLGLTGETIRAYIRQGWLTGQTASGKLGRAQRIYLDRGEVEAFAKGGAPATQAYREQQANAAMPKLKGRRRTVHAA
jgi:hypothetical protein